MSNADRQGPQFLFLQGPPGPFFRQLAEELAKRSHGVHRINLCGGDRYDWPEGGLDYRGRVKNWPLFFDRYVQAHGITDLVLYGDCRPMHQSAMRLARLRGVRIHVFEEGYIRPNWMTLERDGVNGHSSFDRDPDVILAAAQWLPALPELPDITADFRRRARDSYWHYHHVVTGRLLFKFPFYRSHRQEVITAQGIGWILRFARAQRRGRQAEATLRAIAGHRYFLFPLQLTGDYQIRAHSPFQSMPIAADYVLESFAKHAPADSLLVVKEHPLDSGFRNWRSHLRRRAQRLGLEGRVLHIDGGDLQALAGGAEGMVVVNSTSGTLALEVGIPVIVLGDAVYDVPGVTHHGLLDDFWSRPEPPSRHLYQAFKKLLHARCMVRGGLASESASQTLVANSIERLLSEWSAPPRLASMPAVRQALGTRPASSR
ncbi:MAG: capsular biosynthesis protein [Novosphingobium sp.]